MPNLRACRSWNLPALGWIYVGAMGVLAAVSSAFNLAPAYLAVLVLTLPVGILYFPLGLALFFIAGPVLGLDPGKSYWPIGVVWVVMWLLLAWTNAKLIQVSWLGLRRWRAQRRNGDSADVDVSDGTDQPSSRADRPRPRLRD